MMLMFQAAEASFEALCGRFYDELRVRNLEPNSLAFTSIVSLSLRNMTTAEFEKNGTEWLMNSKFDLNNAQ